jgi:hypothetical protein
MCPPLLYSLTVSLLLSFLKLALLDATGYIFEVSFKFGFTNISSLLASFIDLEEKYHPHSQN